jgi:hypothetical protein
LIGRIRIGWSMSKSWCPDWQISMTGSRISENSKKFQKTVEFRKFHGLPNFGSRDVFRGIPKKLQKSPKFRHFFRSKFRPFFLTFFDQNFRTKVPNFQKSANFEKKWKVVFFWCQKVTFFDFPSRVQSCGETPLVSRDLFIIWYEGTIKRSKSAP